MKSHIERDAFLKTLNNMLIAANESGTVEITMKRDIFPEDFKFKNSSKKLFRNNKMEKPKVSNCNVIVRTKYKNIKDRIKVT